MIRDPVIQVVCSDLGGQVRGKGFPAREKPARMQRGVGWVPTNSMITCFNTIGDGPYGSTGDLLLVPDETAECRVDWQDGQPADHFIIGDLVELDGSAWACCPRSLLRKALEALQAETGLRLRSAFEHEFWLSQDSGQPWNGFSLDSYRRNTDFSESLVAGLEIAQIRSDTVIAEYGAGQMEFTVAPALGMRAADECIMLRELARSLAARMGRRASFSPVVMPGIGNGLHVHFSLEQANGQPATHQADGQLGLTRQAGQFVAGLLAYMPEILALTAPSAISHERLQPHRWSAAFNNVAMQDREAALRICPVVGLPGFQVDSQYHLEFRAADATGNPYLQLAALVFAGLQGIRDQLPVPAPTTGDLSLLDAQGLAALGVERLPTSLPASLQRMQSQSLVAEWFGQEFVGVYVAHKQAEMAHLEGRDPEEVRRLYASVY